MPHITEGTVEDMAERIVKGARVQRRYWTDADPAHRYLGDFHTAWAVKRHKDGSVTVTTTYHTDQKGRQKLDVHWAAGDVVAVVDMKPLGNTDIQTYAHHDDRLTIPGGYLAAHPGTMWREWDAYTADGARIAERVDVEQGRAIIARESAPMLWARYGHEHIAQGRGRRWLIVEHTDGEGKGGTLYTLWARPLNGQHGTGEYVTVAEDCKSLEEAKEAAHRAAPLPV